MKLAGYDKISSAGEVEEDALGAAATGQAVHSLLPSQLSLESKRDCRNCKLMEVHRARLKDGRQVVLKAPCRELWEFWRSRES